MTVESIKQGAANPAGASFRHGLITAAGEAQAVRARIQMLVPRYPQARFDVLADERSAPALIEDWPDLVVQAFPLERTREREQALLSEVMRQNYDVCALLYGGDAQDAFLRQAGEHSGARSLLIWDDAAGDFTLVDNHPPRSLRLRALLALSRSSKILRGVNTALGYLVVSVRVIPLLMNAWRSRNRPNPFLDR